MSLIVAAVTGILVGFSCIALGFFLEDGEAHHVTNVKEHRVRRVNRRAINHRKKAA